VGSEKKGKGRGNSMMRVKKERKSSIRQLERVVMSHACGAEKNTLYRGGQRKSKTKGNHRISGGSNSSSSQRKKGRYFREQRGPRGEERVAPRPVRREETGT